jgi:adenylyltransferase/sulfurtransferase
MARSVSFRPNPDRAPRPERLLGLLFNPPPDERLKPPRGPLGVVPGVIGAIQATEAVKMLLGIGEPLINRLLIYDALALTFRQVQVRRDRRCRVCGQR